jgi:hypothetical protein
VVYWCLKGRTGFYVINICHHLKKIRGRIVGFSVKLHLDTSSLGISSRYFYGGLDSQRVKLGQHTAQSKIILE